MAALLFDIGSIVALIFTFLGAYPLHRLSLAAWMAPLVLSIFAWFVAFMIATLFRMPNNSRVAVSIECANQNAGFAIAIIILSLGQSEALDIALGIPMLYSLDNYALCLLMGFILKKVGFLKYDENDQAGSMSKVWRSWRGKDDDEAAVKQIPMVQSQSGTQMPSPATSPPKSDVSVDVVEDTGALV